METTSRWELIQGYIGGRMSDLEMAAFEERLTADPNLVEEFETSLCLREGLEILRIGKELNPSTAPRRWRMTLAFRASVIVLALVVALLGVLRYARPSSAVVARTIGELHFNASQALRVSAHYTFATVRGTNEPPTLKIPFSGALELRALTFSPSGKETFRVLLEEIESHHAARIGEVKHLEPDVDGFVMFYVDASKLKPGDYVMNVQPDTKDLPPQRFEFRLAATPATHPELIK